jgi:hypothetical protein
MSNDTPKKSRGWIYLLVIVVGAAAMLLIPKHKPAQDYSARPASTSASQ